MIPGKNEQADGRVGVVIPLYNRAGIVLQTLQSLLEQELQPVRLAIVDDGSSDGSADAAEHWLTEHDPAFEWVVIRAPHRHAAAARNRGFAEMTDLPLVTFLDSDDC